MRRVVVTPFADDPLVTEPVQFGATLRAARTHAGLTLEEAAMLAGVSKQTLSDLENAKASVGLSIALKVANQLGVGLFAVGPGRAEPIRRALQLLRPPIAPEALATDQATDKRKNRTAAKARRTQT